MKKIIIVLVLMILLAGCVAPEDEYNSYTNASDTTPGIVYASELNGTGYEVDRFIDREAGAICWVVVPDNDNAVGISCFPLSSTDAQFFIMNGQR